MMFRTALPLATVAAIGLSAAPASAGFYSGEQLLEICTAKRSTPDYLEKTYECVAYITGAVDAFNTTREVNKLKSCIPGKVTVGQLREATVDYLLANAKERDKSASTLVFAATRKAWPCPKGKAKSSR